LFQCNAATAQSRALPVDDTYEAVVEKLLKIPRFKLRQESIRQIDFACLDQASRHFRMLHEINANAGCGRAQVLEQFGHRDSLADVPDTKAKHAGSRVRIQAGPMLLFDEVYQTSHID